MSLKKDKSILLLESDNITSSIIQISLPMMITGFVEAFYNTVDSIFVGKFVGELALAALAVNIVLNMTLLSIGSLFSVGVTSIISRALGAKNYEKVQNVLVNGLAISFVSLLILSLMMLRFLDSILIYMGSAENVLAYSRDYAEVLLWGGFVIPLNGILFGMLRSKGSVKSIMFLSVLGAFVNIVLDALFIIVFQWEVKGAAYATIIAQLLILFIALYKVFKEFHIKLSTKYFHYLTWDLIWEILSIGVPNLLRMMVFTMMGVTANRALAPYGVAAVASFGIMNRIMHLAYQPIFGSNLATQTLIGFNYGANRFIKVKKIILQGYLIATILGFIPTIIFISVPKGLFQLFTNKIEILTYLYTATKIIGATFFLYGFQIFSTGSLLAMGHPKQALFLSLFRPCVMVASMIILPMYLHELGVWVSFPLTDIISSIATAVIMYYELKQLQKRNDALKKGY